MKLLVCGGAGFIGSNFIRYKLQSDSGVSIVNFDKLTYAGNPDNLKDIERNSNYEFVKGDICGPDLANKLAKGKNAIINFAADTHVDRSIYNADDFLKTNIFGTYQLLEAAKGHKIGNFVQISTDEVYGSIEAGSFKESNPLHPNSPYSASKAAADLLALSYYKTYNLPVVITRSSNNFGPYQYPEKIIPLFITNALEDKPLPLYGDGLNVRDWLCVADNCEAIDLVLHKGKPGDVYNIGANCEKTNKELTEDILKKMDKPSTLVKQVTDRPGHDRRYSLNCDKLHNLGWKSKYNFDEALLLTINWYSENKSWWQRIKEGKTYKEHYSACYGARL